MYRILSLYHATHKHMIQSFHIRVYGFAAAFLAAAAGSLAADGADGGWQSYAVYQPEIERAFVCDASAQELKYNHDSSVEWFVDRWFCVWNANAIPREGAPGQLNYVSESPDGLAWSAPRAAFSDPEICVNPVPCPKGTQWQPNLIVVNERLWALWSQSSKDEHHGCYLSVLDAPGGRWTNRRLTWDGRADPVIEGREFRVFPTQNPVRLSTGRILAPVTLIGPVSASAPEGKSGWYWSEKRNSVVYTDDGGETWHVSPGAILPGLDWRQWEPTVFERPDGSVMMFARNNIINPSFEPGPVSPAEAMVRSVSRDGGATWTPHEYVPLQTVVSRMHVLRQNDCDRYLMIHNDWPAGKFGPDRYNLALFFNRGGGMDFVAGPGVSAHEPQVMYPQMAFHGNALLAVYSQSAVGLRNIRAVRVSPLPDPGRLHLLPRTNLPVPPVVAVDRGVITLGGGVSLACRTAPAVTTNGVSCAAWIRPEDSHGVLFDNRRAGGFVWGVTGVCFAHVGDPAENLRSNLDVPPGQWSYVGLTLDYARGEAIFFVNDRRERVTFKPGRRSMHGASATIAGRNSATSALTSFTGGVRGLAVYADARLSDDAHRALHRAGVVVTPGLRPSLLLDPSDPESINRTVVIPRIDPGGAEEVGVVTEAGRAVLRIAGAASAGVELAANDRAAGDGVELEFSFRIERGDGQTLLTAGDANQPARIVVRGDSLWLVAGPRETPLGRAARGEWQRLSVETRGAITRATLEGQPPAEVRHHPEATWIYLGEGYRPAEPPPAAAFAIDIGSVRSRIRPSVIPETTAQ